MSHRWTLFKHNFGRNETSGAETRSGQFAQVVVHADRETAIEWWEEKYDEDPTRWQSWPDTQAHRAWNIIEVEDEGEVLAEFPDIETESGGIGVPHIRPTSMDHIRQNDKTLVMQRSALGEDIELPEQAAERARKPADEPDDPENAAIGEDTRGPPEHAEDDE